MIGPLLEQERQLKERFPEATLTARPDGTYLVTVPNCELPAGWSKPRTDVHFVGPVGYPMAKPDCFWADPDLRLASGAPPQSSGINPAAGLPNAIWFSYHPQNWDPSRDSLLTYLRVIRQRLNTVQ